MRACTDHLVVELRRLVRVLERAEAREAAAVRVHAQRAVREHEHVDAEVELLAADQQRVHNVALDDVGLGSRRFWLPPQLILPLSDLLQFVEQEDAATLRLADRFHDPYLRAFLELLYEQAVVTRQVECRREEVIAVRFGLLVLALELLLVTL